MKNINVDHKVSRSIFPWGFEHTYTITAELDDHEINKVVDYFSNDFLPFNLYSAEDVINIKGGIGNEKPEMLYLIAGQAHYHEEGDDDIQDGEEPSKKIIPVSYEITTSFKGFPGNHKIEYDLHHFNNLTPELQPYLLTKTGYVDIYRFELEFELFKSRLLGVLGFAPTINESFSLKVDKKHLKLVLWSESLRKKANHPLASVGLFQKIYDFFHQQ